jgi:carboxypeptidase family protein
LAQSKGLMRRPENLIRFRWLIGAAVGLMLFIPLGAVSSSQPASPQPVVRMAVRHDASPPLRSLPPLAPHTSELTPARVPPLPQALGKVEASQLQSANPDPALQAGVGGAGMPSPIRSFEGLSNDDNLAVFQSGFLPPDPNGDVGPGHYIQWVNGVFAIWDKDGHRLYGPAAGRTLWQNFGGLCEQNNDGDPIVLYDQLANRWLMSQLAYDTTKPEFHQCIAISQMGDPTGGWYRYDYLISTSKFNDYPKFGVWPDAYYLAVNQFVKNDWGGQGVLAFDRAKMLAGQPAAMIYFDLFNLDRHLGGMLPADLDGANPPPPGSPNYFVEFDDDAGGYSPDQLQVWRFHVDWGSPSASTFTGPQVINLSTQGLGFDSMLCTDTAGHCVDQPDTDVRLDSLSDRLMYRLAYRNFGDHQALVVNHSVNANGRGRAGIRWYELRLPGGTPTLYQAGTYAPDGDHRWMGSLALDGVGNMALGYSVSSAATYPSIRYTGRLAGDPLGVLLQGEATLVAGGGSQVGLLSRWGDYSMMTVDPVDDCTFWYTQEYYPADSPIRWHTRIGAFKFPSCTLGPRGRLEGTVKDAATGLPLSSVIVLAGANTTFTDSTGRFQFAALPAGAYDITASLYGYVTQTAAGILVTDGGSRVQDFALTPHASATVRGVVTQGSGHSWPLYARLAISASGYSRTVFTDPFTGAYSVSLFQGVPYTFTVNAFSAGDVPIMQAVTPSSADVVQDFVLEADLAACFAPGFQPEYVYLEDFETGDGGFRASGTTTWAWGVPTSGPGYAYSGAKVWATNLSGNYAYNENSHLTSLGIDLSAYAGQTLVLTWWQWLQTRQYEDFARVEVSKDGGTSWVTVYGEVGGIVDSAWTVHRVTLDPGYAVGDFRLRFGLRAASGGFDGYYVDHIGIGVIPAASTIVYSEDFESGDGGYAVSSAASWAWGIPTSGPSAPHSGARVWATNLSGDYGDNENSSLTSPAIDLSAYAGQTPVVSWWQWLETESGFDFASVEVSQDSGATWQPVYGSVSGQVDSTWTRHRVALDPRYAVSGFQVRFRLRSDLGVTAPGFYLDDVTVEMLPTLPPGLCRSQAGGLLVGHTYDDKLSFPVNGVRVGHADGSAITLPTPDDPAVPDGYYSLFTPTGSRDVTASFGSVSVTQTVSVQNESIVARDFFLPLYVVILTLIMR